MLEIYQSYIKAAAIHTITIICSSSISLVPMLAQICLEQIVRKGPCDEPAELLPVEIQISEGSSCSKSQASGIRNSKRPKELHTFRAQGPGSNAEAGPRHITLGAGCQRSGFA